MFDNFIVRKSNGTVEDRIECICMSCGKKVSMSSYRPKEDKAINLKDIIRDSFVHMIDTHPEFV